MKVNRLYYNRINLKQKRILGCYHYGSLVFFRYLYFEEIFNDMSLTINIPDDIWQAIRLPETDRQGHLLIELAVSLYQRGILSLGKARSLAGMTKWEFHETLGKRKTERHYNQDDLDNDIEYGFS